MRSRQLLVLLGLVLIVYVRATSKSVMGKGFKKPFFPADSVTYHPHQSSTFKIVEGAQFVLTYADNSKLLGYQGIDVVQLGDFFVHTRFGAITDCNSPDFNNVSGILGMGMPTVPMPGLPGLPSMNVPPPLLFDLSDSRIKDNSENHILPRRAFSFMSTHEAAELQLGGYDPAAIVGEMFVTPSIQPTEYMVPVLSIKFGDVELLEFTEMSESINGVLDSGTSCLVLPDITAGLLQEKPYSKWLNLVKNKTHPVSHDSFFINIAGREFEIPFDTWYMTQGSVKDQSCVQSMPGGVPIILIGDVLFRNYLVMFDLEPFTHGGPIMLGIGKQNPKYKLSTFHDTIKKVPAKKKAVTGNQRGHYQPPQAESRERVRNFEQSQYFINVSIGTPRQTMEVILDSGSAEFGVFSKCPAGLQNGQLRCDFGRETRRRNLLEAEDHSVDSAAAVASQSLLVGCLVLFSVLLLSA